MKLSPRGLTGMGLISLAGLAATCGSALGQSTWLNPVDGVWSDGSKWSAGVPNGIAAIVNQPGTYNIGFNGNFSVPSLTQSVPGVTITVSDNLNYNMTGPISNAGVLRINDGTGGNGTYLRLTNGPQTVSGTGTIRLSSTGNVNTAQLVTNSPSWALTQAAGHSVRGDGLITVPMANSGTIAADVNGRTLLVANGGTTNNGLMSALNGGTLQVNSVNVTGTGNMQASNGTVTLNSSSVSTQTVTTSGSGVVNVQNSSFADVTMNGDIRINDNNNLNCNSPGIVNNGTISVNDGTGGNGTYFRLTNGAASLTGNGVLRLRSSGNLNTAQLVTNSPSWTLTHGANHQIRGDGRIYVPINNLGSIIADTTGRNLEILSSTSSNSGLISAENGSTVLIGSATINQSGGIIRAITNGAVILDSSAINSGSVTSTGGAATLIRNTTLNDVVLTGQAQVPDNNNLNVPGAGFTNNGNITIQNGGGNGTYMRLTGGAATVGGTGTVTLNASANLDTAQITTNSGSWTYTSSVGQTIRGTGRIYTPMTNNGTIVADRTGAQLQWLNSSSTNNNLVTTAGGGFTLSSATLTQGANGRIVAANGDVSISNSNVIGGSIQGSGSPVYVYNSTFTNPTVSGDVRIPNNYTLNVPSDGFVNNGTIRVSDNVGGNGTYMRLVGGAATISGTGTIVLDATSNLDTAQLTTNAGSWVMTIASGQTVRGDGRIYTPLTNNGLIVADQAGTALEWMNTGNSTNNTIARTANGAELRLSSLGLTQAANARVLASDGPVSISNSTISGGTLNGQNSPVNIINSTLSGLTTEGDVRVPNNCTLNLPGEGIINNGVISVSDGAGGNGTYVRLVGGASTISGSGSVVLKATANLATAQLITNAGSWTMGFGASQSLRGTGAVFTPVTFAGTMSPGYPEFFTGQINFGGSAVTITSTGRATFDVLSPTDYDRANGSSAWNIQGGTLTIRFPGGFVGALGQSYTLIAGGSVTGRFTAIQLPAHPTQGLKYGVDYRPNAVVLRTTCNIDFNSDGVIDLFDYLDFVEIFQGGTLDADYNGDGITDFFDYLDFVAEFANGCN